MIKIFLLCLLAAGALANTAAIAQAQSAPANQQPASAPTSGNYNNATAAIQNGPQTITLSGCLGRGTGAEEYTLYGQTADTWELKSDSVYLGSLLDQEVRVTALEPANPDGTLTVIGVAMAASGCSQY